jgi:predicted RNA binding protein YcfA (HicA-like mRNA interferase family)
MTVESRTLIQWLQAHGFTEVPKAGSSHHKWQHESTKAKVTAIPTQREMTPNTLTLCLREIQRAGFRKQAVRKELFAMQAGSAKLQVSTIDLKKPVEAPVAQSAPLIQAETSAPSAPVTTANVASPSPLQSRVDAVLRRAGEVIGLPAFAKFKTTPETVGLLTALLEILTQVEDLFLETALKAEAPKTELAPLPTFTMVPTPFALPTKLVPIGILTEEHLRDEARSLQLPNGMPLNELREQVRELLLTEKWLPLGSTFPGYELSNHKRIRSYRERGFPTTHRRKLAKIRMPVEGRITLRGPDKKTTNILLTNMDALWADLEKSAAR